MTKDVLLASASELQQFDSTCVNEYEEKREQLVAKINEVMLQRPDIEELVGGAKNLPMMKDNHSNHARFVISILRHHQPAVLVDTVLWVFRSYRSRGFHQNYWSAQINAWIDILRQEFSPESFQAVYPLYNWFSVNIPAFTDLSDERFAEAQTHGV